MSTAASSPDSHAASRTLEFLNRAQQAAGAETWQTELEELRAEARRRFGEFVQLRVNPGARERDRTFASLPRSVFAEAADIGLLNFSLPREYGGGGRDKFEWGVIIENVGYLARDAGFPILMDIIVEMCELLLSSGKPNLIERYVPGLVRGELIGMPAAYESRDPFAYASTCRRAEDGSWILNGSKHIVAGARISDLFIVYVRDVESNDNLAFVIERGDPGVDVVRMDLMGLHSMGFGLVAMNDVHVDEEERLVWSSDALSEMNTYARNRRVITSCGLVGAMEAITEQCVEALAKRIRTGRPVLDYPNVERAIGQLRMDTEASRAVIYRALDGTRAVRTRDPYFDSLATTAKHFVSDAAMRFGQTLMNLHGGQSYMTIYPWELRMRNFLGSIGGQGAQELLQIQLGQRTIVGLEGQLVRREAAARKISRAAEAWWGLVAAALHGRDGAGTPTGPVAEALDAVRAAAGEIGGVPAERLASLVRSLPAAPEDVTPPNELIEEPEGSSAAKLLRSASLLPVLDAALASGLIDDLYLPRTAAHLAQRTGLAPEVAQRLLDALTDSGLLARQEDEYLADVGVQRLLLPGSRRVVVEAEVRGTLLEARELVETLEEGRAPAGVGPASVEARGRDAAYFCDAILDRLLPSLEGLDERVQAADAALLYAGVDFVSIELCRRIPHLRAVHVAPTAADAIASAVERAHLAERIEVRTGALESADSEGAFALIALSTLSLDPQALPGALARAREALIDGGWILLDCPAGTRGDLGAAVQALRSARLGGTAHESDELEAALREAGFGAVKLLDEVPGLRRHLVAGRRLPQ